MNSDQLNRWISVGANTGVLIGIVLLIYELNQNREMMRSQVRQQITQGEASWALATAENQQLAELAVKAASGVQLEGSDELQYRYRLTAYFRNQENIHFQVRQGLFDEAEFEAIKNQWRAFGSVSEGVRREWCVLRGSMSAEFKKDMDVAFENLDCPSNSE